MLFYWTVQETDRYTKTKNALKQAPARLWRGIEEAGINLRSGPSDSAEGSDQHIGTGRCGHNDAGNDDPQNNV